MKTIIKGEQLTIGMKITELWFAGLKNVATVTNIRPYTGCHAKMWDNKAQIAEFSYVKDDKHRKTEMTIEPQLNYTVMGVE